MKKIILTISMALLVLITPSFALKETTIYLPAVEETEYGYEGVLATLTVDIKEGEGHVYVDTWPLTKIDTQASARMAKNVACNLLYIDCSNYNFYYTIRSEAQIVGGPSGGAAMTIATLASLLDLNIDNKVFITGTINLDGSIGPVGGIFEKAKIVSEKGNTFLIPYGQSTIEKEKMTSEEIGSIIIKKSEQEQINIKNYAKEQWNLSVEEVKTVRDAFKYFTDYEIKEPELKFKRTEKYQEVMKKMAEELIERSSKLEEHCKTGLNSSKLNYEQNQQISEICNKDLSEARHNYNKENYYSAASIAFSKGVSYRYGEKLAEFLESEDKKYYLKDYLDNIEKELFKINTTNIELYAIIEERLSEVQEKLENAWRAYYNENYIEGINQGSFAQERLYTAKLWMKYADEFPSYIKKESKFLKEISKDMLSETSSIITYTSLSSSNIYTQMAKDFLERGKDSYKKENYYATIIDCLKGQVNAELASEILFKDKAYLVELHKNKALLAINKTNSIIGQSYFEYARTLENENKDTALIYYTYAEKLSSLSKILNKEPKTEQIIPENYIEKVSCNYEMFYSTLMILAAIAFSIGIILGRKL